MLALTTFIATLAVAPAEAPPTSAPPPPPIWRRIGGFVGLDWRVLGLAGHLSHGPGFQAGAIFFDHLALGIAGFARPGPINPKTFAYDLPGGTYKGKSRVHLRSDGAIFGLLVSPFVDLRRVPISLELPVMVGYAGFGFYLSGDDRRVPDDRRVSEWEDEILDGKDSDPSNIAIDIGLRLAWLPSRARFLRPYIGLHYTFVPGFDTAVRASYDGFSGVLGVKFGKFPSR